MSFSVQCGTQGRPTYTNNVYQRVASFLIIHNLRSSSGPLDAARIDPVQRFSIEGVWRFVHRPRASMRHRCVSPSIWSSSIVAPLPSPLAMRYSVHRRPTEQSGNFHYPAKSISHLLKPTKCNRLTFAVERPITNFPPMGQIWTRGGTQS